METFLKYILPVIILSVLGLIFGILIAIISKRFKVKKDPFLEKVAILKELLPGYNCGSCGALSCEDFAKKLLTEGVDVTKCRPLKKEKHESVRIKVEELKK